MAVAQLIDLNHYAVFDANTFYELVGAEIVGPSLDFKVPGRLAGNAAGSMSIPGETMDRAVSRYLRGFAAIFQQIRARASLFNQLAATPYGFGEQQ